MESKYTNIVTEYPEIIKELTAKTESDELRRFNLSSFMSDRSLDMHFRKLTLISEKMSGTLRKRRFIVPT